MDLDMGRVSGRPPALAMARAMARARGMGLGRMVGSGLWAAAVCWNLFYAADAAAHGVGGREAGVGAARAVCFAYSSGEPMAFAKAVVYAPNATTEFQNARADGQGCFAFVPTGPGDWRVAASDHEGHRAEIIVVVAEPAAGGRDGAALGADRVVASGLTAGVRSGDPGQGDRRDVAGNAGPNVGGEPETATPPGSGLRLVARPGWLAVLAGLSLIANAALGLLVWRGGGRSGKGRP